MRSRDCPLPSPRVPVSGSAAAADSGSRWAQSGDVWLAWCPHTLSRRPIRLVLYLSHLAGWPVAVPPDGFRQGRFSTSLPLSLQINRRRSRLRSPSRFDRSHSETRRRRRGTNQRLRRTLRTRMESCRLQTRRRGRQTCEVTITPRAPRRVTASAPSSAASSDAHQRAVRRCESAIENIADS
jgi:hypothetical protein